MAFNPFNGSITTDAANSAGYSVGAGGRLALANYLGWVINIVLSLLGVIFTCLVVYGGFRWLTARGNESQVDEAKGIIRHAIIGLFITVSASAIWAAVSIFLRA